MMRYAQQQYVARTEESVRELKRLNHELASANQEVGGASRAIQQLNDELFLTLSKMIDARDPYVAGHSAKVADYATSIAIELELPAERIAPIRQAGLLHDIGKIGVSEHILHKPGKLTPEEYEQVKTHANLGAEFLETSRGLRHLAPFVRHHHERWDGRGYPQGLVGEQTPLEARILAVCDAVEAMASDRPYQRAMSLEEIITEVQRGRGTHFDPIMADTFIRIAQREGACLLINSAEQVTRKQSDALYGCNLHEHILRFGKERV
jgi:putative nucleotidyltransferase with HDIG domain